MSYCRVCGDEENTKFYAEKGMQTLCRSCAQDTPKKIGSTEFYRRYFGENYETECPLAIRKEFYEDYSRSCYTYAEYEKATIRETL